jgi:hypothetical protein
MTGARSANSHDLRPSAGGQRPLASMQMSTLTDESTIRLDRDLLLRSPELADAFLDGRLGAILHEVAHYAAANVNAMVRGHLIIHASSRARGRGFRAG